MPTHGGRTSLEEQMLARSATGAEVSMRSIAFAGLVVSLSVVGAGCGSDKPDKSQFGGSSDPNVFASRLEAARAIGDNTTRDDALAKVAVDAAASSAAEVARNAIAAISNSAKKD